MASLWTLTWTPPSPGSHCCWEPESRQGNARNLLLLGKPAEPGRTSIMHGAKHFIGVQTVLQVLQAESLPPQSLPLAQAFGLCVFTQKSLFFPFVKLYHSLHLYLKPFKNVHQVPRQSTLNVSQPSQSHSKFTLGLLGNVDSHFSYISSGYYNCV